MTDDFDPDEYLASIKDRLSFKTPQVSKEFDEVDPSLRNIASNSPYPLIVTSGKRTPEENDAVRGVPNSMHKTGEALDLRRTPEAIQSEDYFKGKGYKVLDEGDHIHVEGHPQAHQASPHDDFDPDAYLAGISNSSSVPYNSGMFKNPGGDKLKTLANSFSNPEQGAGDVALDKNITDLKANLPTDLAKFTGPVAGMEIGGGLGSALGPAGTVGGGMIGAGLGSIAAYKAAQGLNTLKGNFPAPGTPYIPNEAYAEARNNAVMPLIGPAMEMLSEVPNAYNGIKTWLTKSGAPQNLYKRATGLLDNGAFKEIQENNPEKANEIVSSYIQNLPSKQKALGEAVNKERLSSGQELNAAEEAAPPISGRQLKGALSRGISGVANSEKLGAAYPNKVGEAKDWALKKLDEIAQNKGVTTQEFSTGQPSENLSDLSTEPQNYTDQVYPASLIGQAKRELADRVASSYKQGGPVLNTEEKLGTRALADTLNQAGDDTTEGMLGKLNQRYNNARMLEDSLKEKGLKDLKGNLPLPVRAIIPLAGASHGVLAGTGALAAEEALNPLLGPLYRKGMTSMQLKVAKSLYKNPEVMNKVLAKDPKTLTNLLELTRGLYK